MAKNRTDMKKVKGVSAAIVVGLSLVVCSESALSLGFGRSVSRAILGETLSLTVPLHLEAGEVIADDCVAADVFFGDDKQSQLAVKASLLPGDGPERTVRVVTTSLVNEPVVTVYLAAGCKAKMTRKFVAFADPPGLSLPEGGAPVASSRAAGPAGASAVRGAAVQPGALAPLSSPDADTAPRALAAPKSPKPGKTPVPRKATATAGKGADQIITEGSGVASATAPLKVASQHKSAPVAKRAAAPAPKTETARLVLDPAEVDALVAPNLMMSSALSGLAADIDAPDVKERRAAAAALWAAMNSSPEQLARDRQRMQDLEQRLARLQQESNGARDRVATMEARVREVEDHRLRHPLVYALVALCALLAGAVAWLWTRQRRQPAEAATSWWQGEPGDAADTGASTPEHQADTPGGLAEPALARTSAEFMPRTAPAPVAEPEMPATPAAAPAPTTSVPAPAASGGQATGSTMISRPVLIRNDTHEAREITVEELIDLEQQAEFFVVLGQDDAAIELLEGHVQSTAGASPLPYLKLLEIYQRLDRREDYERVREVFNSRFNAYAPSWESDLKQGHALEEYPGVIERLQSLWSVPARAMEVLEVSLTRADGSTETFDLPAYRELLFLYGVARDLSERESQDRAPVDLLLPVQDLGDTAGDEVDVPTMLQPLMATRPVKALPEVTPSLSLDLSLDDPVPSEAASGGAVVDAPPAASAGQGPGDDGNGIDFEHVDVPQRKP